MRTTFSPSPLIRAASQARQYHAGIWWPHQIWREMHQSRMLRIHSNHVFSHCSGRMRVRPSSTARIASFASGATFTNHCGVR
jgi:hypothetical protein